jgi:hypothetical protein
VNRTLSGTAIGAGAAFLACCAVFAWLAAAGASRTALMAPAALGSLAALVALREVTPGEKHVALNFAFAVLALTIFFIHETYGYTGQVRNFPLIVGYSGIVLCVLDILSVGETPIGQTIARFFGSRLDVAAMSGRPLKREIAAFAAMGAGVLGIWLLGFLVASPVFVTVWMLVGGKSLKGAFYGGVVTLAFVYLLFEVAFQYELFRGVVFLWLLDL